MRRSKKHVRCFIALFLLSAVLLSLEYWNKQRAATLSSEAGRLATIAFTPVIKITRGTFSQVNELYHRMSFSGDVWEEKEHLSAEVERLHTLLRMSEEKNLQLERLIHLTSDTLVTTKCERVIPAEVLSIQISPLSCTMTINKGYDDGVYVNSVIAYGKGLVGSVVSTMQNSSVVQLLFDPRNTVSGVIAGSRQLCLVKSRGANDELSLTVETSTVKPEESALVLCSGIDNSMYPKGLVIGTILGVETTKRGHVTADVVPFVDFNTLEEVVVIPAKPTPLRQTASP